MTQPLPLVRLPGSPLGRWRARAGAAKMKPMAQGVQIVLIMGGVAVGTLFVLSLIWWASHWSR